jgi:adenylylsulfate kinase
VEFRPADAEAIFQKGERLPGTFCPRAGRAFTIWFTGLSGAGKSTLARALGSYLESLALPFELLDGDELRHELCRDLGFSKQDRDENVRRIACVAKLLNRHEVIAVVAAIAPYRDARLKAREMCGRFVEVFIDCPLKTLIDRDTKGLYHRALTGDLEHFSGVSDPYERPEEPDVYINSASQSQEESIAVVLTRLSELQLLPEKFGKLSA